MRKGLELKGSAFGDLGLEGLGLSGLTRRDPGELGVLAAAPRLV